jgi:hypothetical protein
MRTVAELSVTPAQSNATPKMMARRYMDDPPYFTFATILNRILTALRSRKMPQPTAIVDRVTGAKMSPKR